MKRIALDLDGVCVDFMGAFLRRYNDVYSTNFNKEDVTEYDIAKALGEPTKQVMDLINEMQMDERSYRDFPMMTGANYFTNRLIKEGHKIYVVSDRPNATDTQIWLTQKGIGRNGEYLTGDKLNVMNTKGLDWLIEDRREMALKGIRYGKNVILLDQPWNQLDDDRSIIRCKDWREIYEVLK